MTTDMRSVLAELMNDDGTVMRGPQIAAFAEHHKLARVTIADLIAYRQARERLVERVGEFPVESEIGMLAGYAYLTHFDPFYHVAFVYGDISDGRAVPTRLHRANLILDVFGGAKAVRELGYAWRPPVQAFEDAIRWFRDNGLL